MTFASFVASILLLMIPVLIFGRNQFVPVHLKVSVAFAHFASSILTVIITKDLMSGSDAILYYYDTAGFLSQPVSLGTSLITYAASIIASSVKATYIDETLIFSCFGLIAVSILVRLNAKLAAPSLISLPASLFFLIPGIHFWTSSISKDGLVLLGIVIVLTAMVDFPRKLLLLMAGLLLIFVIRPHIALFTVAAIGLQQATDLRRPASIALAIMLAVGSVIVGRLAFLSLLNVDVFDLQEVSLFLVQQQDFLSSTTAYRVQIIDNPVLRILGFLIFPLFFNAEGGIFGIIASIENLVLIGIFFVISRAVCFHHLMSSKYARFLFIYAVILIILIGIGNYNIGLGLRQKIMIYPMLSVLFTLSWKALGRTHERSIIQSDFKMLHQEPVR